MKRNIVINNDSERVLIEDLKKKNDTNSERIKRLLELPDLTKKPNRAGREDSPVKILVDRVVNLPRFDSFDLIEFPRIVPSEYNFDILNTPASHPSRRKTDTYYIDDENVLRTHTTTMWPYYLKDAKTLEKLEKDGFVAALSKGIVFRKDEIDKKHFPAFHQIDGLYICKKDKKNITLDDLKEVETEMTKSIFGEDIEYKFLVDSFPFTDPSVQIEMKFGDSWIEVVGSGLVHSQVLKNLGLDPEIYNGWAFGFGIERLAMVKFEIPDIRIFWSENSRITSQFKDINSKYKEVSKYPAVERDISFIIDKGVALNNYYELVRDEASSLVEQVELVDSYENDEKFGTDRKSYTFRIVYRSLEKTLTNEEVNIIHDKISEKTKSELNAIIR